MINKRRRGVGQLLKSKSSSFKELPPIDEGTIAESSYSLCFFLTTIDCNLISCHCQHSIECILLWM